MSIFNTGFSIIELMLKIFCSFICFGRIPSCKGVKKIDFYTFDSGMKQRVVLITIFFFVLTGFAQNRDSLIVQLKIFKDAGQYQKGLQILNQYLENNATDGEIWFYKANFEEAVYQWRKAISAYSKAITYNANQPYAFYHRGYCYYNVQEFSNALQDFINFNSEKIEEIKPDLFYFRALSRVKLEKEFSSKFCEDLQKGIRLNHDESLKLYEKYCKTK